MKFTVWSRLGLLVVLFQLAGTASATDPEPLPVLRWPDVAGSVDRHPSVVEAKAAQAGAGGAVSTAGAFPNPVFAGTAGDARPRDGSTGGREWSYSVGMPLDFLATRGSRVAAAAASEESARQGARAARALALRELRRAFVVLAHDQAVVEASTELEGQVAKLAELVRKRAERGEGRPTEVPRVEIEVERLRAALDRARAAVEASRQRLSVWYGGPVGRVEADLSVAIPLPTFDALRDRVLSASPVAQAARSRVEASAASARAERWERFPKVSVEGTRAEELDQRVTTIGATVALPLWNWNGGKIRQADAALEADRARLDAATRGLTASLGEAWQGCAAGQASSRRFQQEILPRADRSARSLGRAFELGEAGLLDVIDSRRVLLDTRREALDQLLEMQNACGDLAALAELELP